MEIILKSRKIRVKKKINRDHHWYDHITKQRFHGRGGRMVFVYDQQQKRNLPRIVDDEEFILDNSYNDIIRIVKQLGLNVIYQAKGLYVIVEVDANELSELENILYRNRIQYDYDEKELKN